MDVGGLATTGRFALDDAETVPWRGALIAGRSLIVWARRNRLEPASSTHAKWLRERQQQRPTPLDLRHEVRGTEVWPVRVPGPWPRSRPTSATAVSAQTLTSPPVYRTSVRSRPSFDAGWMGRLGLRTPSPPVNVLLRRSRGCAEGGLCRLTRRYAQSPGWPRRPRPTCFADRWLPLRGGSVDVRPAGRRRRSRMQRLH
jgi:hypothetical protein